MTERGERRAIVRLQTVEQRLARGDEILLPLPGRAGARIEREHRIDRDVGCIDDVDGLEDAVVAQLEVGGRQAGDRVAAVRDEHVHAHAERARREGLFLGGEDRTRRQQRGSAAAISATASRRVIEGSLTRGYASAATPPSCARARLGAPSSRGALSRPSALSAPSGLGRLAAARRRACATASPRALPRRPAAASGGWSLPRRRRPAEPRSRGRRPRRRLRLRARGFLRRHLRFGLRRQPLGRGDVGGIDALLRRLSTPFSTLPWKKRTTPWRSRSIRNSPSFWQPRSRSFRLWKPNFRSSNVGSTPRRNCFTWRTYIGQRGGLRRRLEEPADFGDRFAMPRRLAARSGCPDRPWPCVDARQPARSCRDGACCGARILRRRASSCAGRVVAVLFQLDEDVASRLRAA